MAKKKKPITLNPASLAAWNAARAAAGLPALTSAAGTSVQVPNAPAKPFLTGDQIIQQGQSQQAHDTGYQTIADSLAQLALGNQYQKQAVEQSRVKGVAGTQDDAAARGIFNSSIKDGGVTDVDAQAATAQQHLVDNMAAAQASAAAQRTILDNALSASTTGFNQSAVENASAIDTGYTTQPAPPAPPAPGAAPAAAATNKPVTTGPGSPQQTTTEADPTGPAGAQAAGYQPGHSIGHEFYLPGVGWVSRARFQAAA